MTTDQKISQSLVEKNTSISTSTLTLQKQFNLFDHQVEAIEFARKNKRCLITHEPGLGKTKIAIVAAGTDSSGMILIVCPASIKINWEREIHIIYPEDNVTIINGGQPPEEEIKNVAWIVINYDILSKHQDWIIEMVKSGSIETVICDEAHYCKDTTTLRTKAMLAVVEHAKKVYCLTGTPVMNKPIEMFSLLKAIKHPLAYQEGVAPSSLRRNYSLRYCEGHMQIIHRRGGAMLRFWEEKGATRLPELKELIKNVIIRRTKDEVLDLPEKIVSVVECEMDPEHQRAYDGAWSDYIEFITKNHDGNKNIGNIMDAQSLVELMKLKQVCSKAKIGRIIADIENLVDQGQKVIVFSQFTGTIQQIMSDLDKKKIGAVSLTGQDDMNQRQKAIDSFQNKESTKVFVANIKAGGVGITLTAASIVIFADMDWSPEIHKQAEDRAHRIGQTGTVNVYYYVMPGTIEEDIMDTLQRKQETIGMLTGGETSIQAFMDLIVKRVESK